MYKKGKKTIIQQITMSFELYFVTLDLSQGYYLLYPQGITEHCGQPEPPGLSYFFSVCGISRPCQVAALFV